MSGSAVRPSICLSVYLCISRLRPAYRHAPTNLSCLYCLTSCAKADCLSRRLARLVRRLACQMRQTYPSHGPAADCCPTTFFPSAWGFVFRSSHRQSKGAKQKQTRGEEGRVGCSGRVRGVVLSHWHDAYCDRKKGLKDQTRQPRAGLTNQPTNPVPTYTHTHRRTGPLYAARQPIPTGPACQDLGFLRS